MNIHLDDKDLQRLEELAKREGRAVGELAAEIFQEALRSREQNGTWIDEVAGSFENDSEFEEVIKLGKDLRKADRPKPKE